MTVINEQFALVAESSINSIMEARGSFDASKAELYSSSSDGKQLELIATHGDVYDLLDFQKNAIDKNSIVVLMTCGWAAPITGDGDDELDCPPSQHPERRRVRLVVCASKQGVASAIRFQDDPENIVTDEGKARGSLADAVTELFV